jgi:RecA/RadA recombinase
MAEGTGRLAALKALQAQIVKQHGQGAFGPATAIRPPGIRRIPTGSLALDFAIGGGFPVGSETELFGMENCVAAETFLQFDLHDPKTGKVFSRKGGTIRRLYERFTGDETPFESQRGRHLQNNTSDFYVKSVDGTGRVIANKVLDVVRAGTRMCFRIEVETGEILYSTPEHKYLTPDGYKPLSDLHVGDVVFVHNNTRVRGGSGSLPRPSVCVKYHPLFPVKIVRDKKTGRDYPYKRGQKSRIAYEAFLNGMSYDDYVDALNTWNRCDIDKLSFVPSGIYVHHIDEDFNNNSIENLCLIDPADHMRHHSSVNIRNLSFIVVESRIVSVEPHGEMETYDLKCEFPNNNYIANGIVVHNSGKTVTALRGIGEAQKLCANCYRPPRSRRVVQVSEDVYDPLTGELLRPAEHVVEGECDCVRTEVFRPRRLYIPVDNRKDRPETDVEYRERIAVMRENSYEELRCALYNIEGKVDWAWAAKLGVDARILHYSQPTSAEEAIDMYCATALTGAVDLMVLDSLATLIPSAEIEEAAEKEGKRGGSSALIGRLVRRMVSATNDLYRYRGRELTQIWINQLRDSMATDPWAPKTKTTGGHAPRFMATLRIKLWASGWEAEDVFAKGDVSADGQIKLGESVRVNFLSEKNQTFASRAAGAYTLLVRGPQAGQVDEREFVLDLAERHGLFGKDGSKWFVRLPGEDTVRCPTKTAATEKLFAEGVRWRVREALLAAMLDGVARGV